MRRAWRGSPPGLRALALFWACLACVLLVGAGILETLGPLAHQEPAAKPAATRQPGRGNSIAAITATPGSVAARPPGRDKPGPIAAPDPALLEPLPGEPGRFLPRISAHGRTPAQVYARGFDPADKRPRIGILVAGAGYNAADSEDAARTLPGEIAFAVSPYAAHPDALLGLARAGGHELLVALPMEPQGYPLNDAGDHALLTGASAEQNADRLDWALSRFAGYVGATSALGLLRGERFAGYASQMEPLLDALAARGLLYVDARPAQHPPGRLWGRSVDLVVDEPAVRTEIEAKLAALEQIARDKGTALGLVGAIRPVTVDRLAAWSNGLAAKGLVLAPVTALVLQPETKDAAR